MRQALPSARKALGDQLRVWRRRVGIRGGTGPLTQQALVTKSDHAFSIRWYSAMEAGQVRRPDHARLSRLSDELGLSQAETDAVFTAAGLRVSPDSEAPAPETIRQIRLLVSRLADPAMATDLLWNIVAANPAFSKWIPIDRKYRSNLAIWHVFSPEARQVFGDEWLARTRGFVESLRFTRLISTDPGPLEKLIESLHGSREFAREWSQYTAAESIYTPGTMITSTVRDAGSSKGLMHVLRPVTAPSLRVVVFTPPDDDHRSSGG